MEDDPRAGQAGDYLAPLANTTRISLVPDANLPAVNLTTHGQGLVGCRCRSLRALRRSTAM